jgi:hypothetical protein
MVHQMRSHLSHDYPAAALVSGRRIVPVSMFFPDLVDRRVIRRRAPAGEQVQCLL